MNYSKLSRQFVCKLAMLLAFMFAACSETDSGNNVAGGTVEETGVYALVGQVGDIYPMVWRRNPQGMRARYLRLRDLLLLFMNWTL